MLFDVGAPQRQLVFLRHFKPPSEIRAKGSNRKVLPRSYVVNSFPYYDRPIHPTPTNRCDICGIAGTENSRKDVLVVPGPLTRLADYSASRSSA